MMSVQNGRAIRRRRVTAAATAAAAAMVVGGAAARASSVSYTGPTYTQTFDSLPNPGQTGSVNTGNPVTIGSSTYSLQSPTFDFANAVDSSPTAGPNSSSGGLGLGATMPGWYGGAQIVTKLGASPGDQTTGGDISFGNNTSSGYTNRALGLLATNTTGNTYFGVRIVNNEATPISAINLAFTAELWRQTAVQQTLNIGYTVDNSNSLSLITAANSSSPVLAYNLSVGSAGTKMGVDGTLPANQTAESFSNLVLNTPLAVGGSIWITGEENVLSGAQGYAIDNFSFADAAAVAAPEPTSFLLAGIVAAPLIAGRRRRGRHALPSAA